MIFLVVFGALMLILSAFYLVNSWQQYRQWVVPTIMLVLSLAATVYGTINLPYWHHSQSAQQTTSAVSSRSSLSSASGSQADSSSSFSVNGTTAVFNRQDSGATQEQKEMYLLRQLQKAYSKMGTVNYDSSSKTYQIMPTNENTVEALNYIAQNPDQAQQAGWSNLTSSLNQTSAQIKKIVGSGYSLSMMKPNDDQTALYTAKDGKQTYSIVNQ
ncbi:DUF308 domain-containing protein [Limosilactobacillus mucosae]|uniref:DUF308 domain-containing protein n=1 Tax=Limosilactobacillus mucosae TaxID=97478 RepID=A0AAJ1HT80_LIMMU|nr:DUF308 domain-containing protein [Limosilactobacillus mucosae]MDC2828846.1 DUF308 domain-containing protein [Limosilactobacillus mucosae]MDC2838190.1 DUF308 domain-containing protein [Limosilactobacillus mucosae]MDC2850112.1 DUF308 domain-containing protein [Limosilactobacillus mucosae]MDC2852502.1 DUF308 domain-containing protein [Limosilactobacillus mucosae]